MRKHIMLAVPVLIAVGAGSAVGATAPDEPGTDGLVTEEVEPGVERIISDDAGHDLDETHPTYRYDMDNVFVTADGTVWLQSSYNRSDNDSHPPGLLLWALGEPGMSEPPAVLCGPAREEDGLGVTCIDPATEERTFYLAGTPINAVAVAPDGTVWAVGGYDGDNGGLYRITPTAVTEGTEVTEVTDGTEMASPTSFTSETYRYTLMLPADWTSVQASKAWDGESGLSSDSAEVDQFISFTGVTASGVAAPSDQTLAAATDAVIAATVQYHGDTCPPTPEAQDPITIGGDPGMLVAWNCGILINIAVTVHDGVGYQFLWRDPAVDAANDPADRAAFLAMLESVQFPV